MLVIDHQDLDPLVHRALGSGVVALGPGAVSLGSSGSETMKEAPWPGWESTRRVPPPASTNPRAMARPRPEPEPSSLAR